MKKLIIKIKNVLYGIYLEIRKKYYDRKRFDAVNFLNDFLGEGEDESSKALLEFIWDNPHHYLRQAMIIKSLRLNNSISSVDCIMREDSNPIIKRFSNKLNLHKKNKLITTPSVNHLKKAKELVAHITTSEDFLRLKLPYDFPPSRLYDGILKKQSLATVDFNDSNVVYYTAQTLFFLDQLNDLFQNNNYRYVLLSHVISFDYGTIAWMGLKHQATCFLVNFMHEDIYLSQIKTIDDFHCPFDAPTPQDIASLNQEMSSRLENIGRNYLSKVRKGQAAAYTAANIFENRVQKTTQQEFRARFNLSDNKPIVVVFGNCWPDYPNTEGPTYYSDYYDWIRLTAQKAQTNENVYWFYRAHPAEFMYGDKAKLKNIIAPFLNKNNYLWPDDLKGNDVESIADIIVTARGSAGIEYPSIGKKVLVASPTHYSSLGFSNVAHTKEEYLSKLENIHHTPSPPDSYEQLANIYIGTTYTSPPEFKKDGYEFETGVQGAKLWSSLPQFIKKQNVNLNREISLIAKWHKSDMRSFSLFKHINYKMFEQPSNIENNKLK